MGQINDCLSSEFLVWLDRQGGRACLHLHINTKHLVITIKYGLV